METHNDEAILERLLRSIGTKKYTALADALGIKPQSISDAKAKKKVPATWVVAIAAKYGVSMDWLVFGQGPAKREQTIPSSSAPELHLPDTGQSDAHPTTLLQERLESRVEELEKENLLLKEANTSHKDALWACKIAIQALQANTEKYDITCK